MMEYISGGTVNSLMEHLREKQGLFPNDLTYYFGHMDSMRYVLYRTLQGLAHLHKNGFVHRDLKPENFLFDSHTLQPKIADFGITCQNETSAEVGMGTLPYIPLICPDSSIHLLC